MNVNHPMNHYLPKGIPFTAKNRTLRS